MMKPKKSEIAPIIDVKNLVKRYKKSTENAVDDISFYVEPGAFFSLLGPNGAGKTTTISILTTILAKTSGSVTISEYDVDDQASQVRQNIGVIFQNPSLDLNLTAEENVRFHANLYGLYAYRPTFSLMPKSYRHKVLELAEILGIKNAIHKPVKTLSGGMKRKLEIIRSLTHNPKVLFLDEPTTGLDPLSRKNLWQYIQEIRDKENVTVFLTTHYLEEAEGSDYLCIINNGKIVAQGKPSDVKKVLVHHRMVMDSNKKIELQKELTKHHLKYTGEGPYTVEIGTHTPQEIVHKIMTPLTTLSIQTPTLEDAYITIIANGGKEQKL